VELWTVYKHQCRPDPHLNPGTQPNFYTACARRVTADGQVLPLRFGWCQLKSDQPLPRGIVTPQEIIAHTLPPK